MKYQREMKSPDGIIYTHRKAMVVGGRRVGWYLYNSNKGILGADKYVGNLLSIKQK